MRKWNLPSIVVAIVVLLSPFASVEANMPPPEPFALGITVAKDADGLRITSIDASSHAQGELRVGDIIVGIDGHWVKGMGAAEQQNAITGRHMWHLEVIVVRARRDILAVEVKA